VLIISVTCTCACFRIPVPSQPADVRMDQYAADTMRAPESYRVYLVRRHLSLLCVYIVTDLEETNTEKLDTLATKQSAHCAASENEYSKIPQNSSSGSNIDRHAVPQAGSANSSEPDYFYSVEYLKDFARSRMEENDDIECKDNDSGYGSCPETEEGSRPNFEVLTKQQLQQHRQSGQLKNDCDKHIIHIDNKGDHKASDGHKFPIKDAGASSALTTNIGRSESDSDYRDSSLADKPCVQAPLLMANSSHDISDGRKLDPDPVEDEETISNANSFQHLESAEPIMNKENTEEITEILTDDGHTWMSKQV